MKIKQIFSFEVFSAKYQHFKSRLVTLNSDKVISMETINSIKYLKLCDQSDNFDMYLVTSN